MKTKMSIENFDPKAYFKDRPIIHDTSKDIIELIKGKTDNAEDGMISILAEMARLSMLNMITSNNQDARLIYMQLVKASTDTLIDLENAKDEK